MMAVFYAVCCLVGSALNDLLFKFFARKRRSRGMLMLLIGIVGTVIAAASFDYTLHNWQMTLLWGVVSGFFSVTANILLIEAMGMQSAGVCSTVYRLNLVPTVWGAWLLLGETIPLLHWIGILFAIGAILCFFSKGSEFTHAKMAQAAKIGTVMVIIGAFLRAAMGISQKYGLSCGADRNGIVLINIFGWAIGGVIYGLLREKRRFKCDRPTLRYGILSGILVLAIIFFMAAAQKTGDAGVVLPIAQMSFPCTLLLSIIFLKEKMTLKKGIGVLLAVAAILLLCR